MLLYETLVPGVSYLDYIKMACTYLSLFRDELDLRSWSYRS
jgi:hypothetical protein